METHAFGNFVPENARYLILGSFTAKESPTGNGLKDPAYDWFYGTKRNQFWPILEEVYGIEFSTLEDKQQLFTRLGIAIADIILKCERKHGSNLDANLINIEYNKEAIKNILDCNKIEKVFFTSRFVETKFLKEFINEISDHPEIELLTLPSPSPRYARVSKNEKILEYKKLLPKTVSYVDYSPPTSPKISIFK